MHDIRVMEIGDALEQLREVEADDAIVEWTMNIVDELLEIGLHKLHDQRDRLLR